MLDQGRMAAIDDGGDQFLAAVAIFGRDLYLDEFMLFQSQVQLGQKRLADTLASGLEQGLQIMGLATEETGLGGGELDRHAVVTGC